MPVIAPIVDEAALLVVVMVIAPPELIEACRLLADSAVLRSFRVEIWPAPVPKVMAVAVPSPVAAMSSVRPASTPRFWLTPVPRPSAASAPALFDEIDRSEVVPVLISSLPPETEDAVVEPVRASILASNVLTVSPTLIWLAPVAPEASNVRVWPSTVMVLPAANAVEIAPDAPDSVVVPLMAAGVEALSFSATPVKVVFAVPSRFCAVAPVIVAAVTEDLVE